MKNKTKYLYWAIAAAMIGWVAFRVVVIASESARVVFNPARDAAIHGSPVETIVVSKKTDVLREPLAVKNGRAFVSCNRTHKFKVGQNVVNGVGTGKITSVSNRVDLDSGMCIVKTSGALSGSVYAQSSYTGMFVPVYAVINNRVMVSENGVAKYRDVKVAASDSENSVIVSGLNDGDIVIVSAIDEGSKIR